MIAIFFPQLVPFLTLLFTGVHTSDNKNVLQLTCSTTPALAAELCLDKCQAKCPEACYSLITDYRGNTPGYRGNTPGYHDNSYSGVSLCGWLQSMGYNSRIILTSNQNSLEVSVDLVLRSSLTRKRRGLRRESIVLDDEFYGNIYPYTKFAFQDQPVSQKVKLGDSVTFYCTTLSNNTVAYLWYNATFGQLPKVMKGERRNTLQIYKTTAQMNGIVMCQATEILTRDTYWSDPATLEVIYMLDDFETRPNSVLTIQSGKHLVEIACSGPKSYPSAVMKWYKYVGSEKKEIINEDSMFYDASSGTLMLINIASGHKGNYVCTATNTVLNKTRNAVTAITVSGSNSVSNKSPSRAIFDDSVADSAVAGQSFTLRCAAYGYPAPKVYWVFGDPATGETLCKIPSTRYSETDNGRIVTLHDMRSHESEYRYICKAENSQDTRSIGTLSNIVISDQLVITQPVTRYTPLYESNLTLSCPVKGSIHNSWYQYGKTLSSTSTVFVNLTSNTVEIPKVDASTHGVYTCLSVSKFSGIAVENLHVSLPVYPLTVHIISNTADSGFITCSASGWPPPRLYWFQNGERVEGVSRITVTFDTNTTIPTTVNKTLNVSGTIVQTEFRCTAVSQTEEWTDKQFAVHTYQPGKVIEPKEEWTMIFILIGSSIFIFLILFIIVILLARKYRKERASGKVLRQYKRELQDNMGYPVTREMVDTEFKYATKLQQIMRSYNVDDDEGIESFREIVGDWMNEGFDDANDAEFARRFRESFVSRKSNPGRVYNSNRYGNNFKIAEEEKSQGKELLELEDKLKHRYSNV